MTCCRQARRGCVNPPLPCRYFSLSCMTSWPRLCQAARPQPRIFLSSSLCDGMSRSASYSNRQRSFKFVLKCPAQQLRAAHTMTPPHHLLKQSESVTVLVILTTIKWPYLPNDSDSYILVALKTLKTSPFMLGHIYKSQHSSFFTYLIVKYSISQVY